ncbi:hypothetical protein [Curtobacterium caseinilyticum]|uniref:Uncharacterized protein n=1 Tax=Curtobacterium caseinilyticum TaxID=3055137 RepID=A0ABT7TSF7_9MICO|nr:hypothetical protein [Curtobacterium caseinilyticum]MDM7892539.1 hypothetical protein [Curtobacterium caseinilyticum]
MTERRGSTIDEGWSATPRITGGLAGVEASRGPNAAPAWSTAGQGSNALVRDRRDGHQRDAGPLGGSSLALAIIAIGVGVLGTTVGVFCVGFITMFGAPLDVTQPAMAGFAFWGTVATAPFVVASVVLLVVGVCRQPRSWWWLAPSLLNAATLLGLWVAVSFWYHPGVHISSDFSS